MTQIAEISRARAAAPAALAASIVIRTLNEGRYLPELMRAIREQEYPAELVEVIVVDSGSTDETLKIAESAGCKIVRIRREEFSFGRSLNLGCAASEGEILVFVSGHCVPTGRNWLRDLLAPFSEETVAVTFGRQVGGAATRFSEHMLFEKYFPANGDAGQAPFFCNNANSAVRQTLWERFRFDESLTGLEDMHLSKQAVSSGFSVRYVPEAGVYHYHHESWKQVRRRYEREAIALQQIMPEVHVTLFDAVRYFVAGCFGDWARAIAQKRFLRFFWEIVLFRFCQYSGAWRGNHEHRKLSHRQKEKYFYP